MLKNSIKLAIILILNLGCDTSENNFFIKNVNIISNGISSTSNIYIEFSNSIDINQFNLLNETIIDADGEEIEQDFTFALKKMGQEFSYITINGIPYDFWYDNSTNTISCGSTVPKIGTEIEVSILSSNLEFIHENKYLYNNLTI